MTDSRGNNLQVGDYVQKQPPINRQVWMLTYDRSKYKVMSINDIEIVLCPVIDDKTITVERIFHTQKSMNFYGLVKIK